MFFYYNKIYYFQLLYEIAKFINMYYKNHYTIKKVMPKLKVRKSAKKRYKLIKGKKFVRQKAFKGHLLEKKCSKRKRNLSTRVIVNQSDTKAIKKMLVC